jgi:hypothetical protein
METEKSRFYIVKHIVCDFMKIVSNLEVIRPVYLALTITISSFIFLFRLLYFKQEQLTLWSWVLINKPTVAHLLKRFRLFYGT